MVSCGEDMGQMYDGYVMMCMIYNVCYGVRRIPKYARAAGVCKCTVYRLCQI